VWCGVGWVFQRVTIESLPDNVLLEIFHFCLNSDTCIWRWETLVHVCRRWRYVTFGSPIRLDLQLYCTERTPLRKSLDVWPEFPLALRFYTESELHNSEDSFDNIVTALERCDRIREIMIGSQADFLWKKLVTAMDKPFPALMSLLVASPYEEFLLPDTFLNGSAPRLRLLALRSISFPSLPQFLSSTTDLTLLDLEDIPNSGYIPPETMARCLSMLPKLESLFIHFRSPTPQPKRRNRPVPPPTRFVHPALTYLQFTGVSEYLEVLAARIDVPVLDRFEIGFFHQLVFDIPQIIRFLGDAKSLSLSSLELDFEYDWTSIRFFSSTGRYAHSLGIYSKRLDWQVFSLSQICSQILPFLSSVNSLVIDSSSRPDPDDMDPTLWLQLFHSFPSVESLTIPVDLEPFIAAALQGLTGESAAEVFPSLHSLSIVGSWSDKATEKGVQSFIAARQHSGHPVAFTLHLV
jgi:F-box-like